MPSIPSKPSIPKLKRISRRAGAVPGAGAETEKHIRGAKGTAPVPVQVQVPAKGTGTSAGTVRGQGQRQDRGRAEGGSHQDAIAQRWPEYLGDGEQQYLEERLTRIESEFRRTLEKAGYSTDPDALGQETWWRKLQADIEASRTPYAPGDRARRALAGLLRVRQLRELLAACDKEALSDMARAVRYALSIGGLEGDVLTDALAITTNRAKASRQGNLRRKGAKQQRRAEVLKFANQIQAEREQSDMEPLSHAALALAIRHKGPAALKGLSVRTIRDYLSSPRKKLA